MPRAWFLVHGLCLGPCYCGKVCNFTESISLPRKCNCILREKKKQILTRGAILFSSGDSLSLSLSLFALPYVLNAIILHTQEWLDSDDCSG